MRSQYAAQIQITNNGVTRTLDKWNELHVRMQKSQTLNWDAVIRSLYGNHIPDRTVLNPGATDWRGWLDGNPYADDDSYLKWLIASGTDDLGNAFTIPTLIQRPGQYEIPPGSQTYDFKIGGNGYADRALQPGQDHPTIQSTSGSHQMAGATLSNLFAFTGLTNSVSISPDFLIPIMHFQDGKEMEQIAEILEIVQAAWRETGSVVQVFQPQFLGGLPSWFTSPTPPPGGSVVSVHDLNSTYGDKFSAAAPTSQVWRYVVGERLQDQGAVVGQGQNNQATDGRSGTKVTFNRPVDINSGIHPRLLAPTLGGVLSDFYYYDSHDHICLVQQNRAPAPPTLSSGPATSVDFTFGQFAGLPFGTTGSYNVAFECDPSGIVTDSTRSYKLDTMLRPSRRKELKPTTLCYSLDVLQNYVQHWALRNACRTQKFTIQRPFLDFTLLPWKWVQLLNVKPVSWDSSQSPFLEISFYAEIDEVDWKLTSDVKQRCTTYTCTRYLW